ncbi:MAG: hypothetical protein ABIJ85_00620 [bacterium]
MKIKKQDINKPVTLGFLHEAVDAILQGMDKMVGEFRGEIAGSFKSVNERFDSLDDKIDFVHKDLQHQISDLKHDTPSLKDFDELKGRVDSFI